ncbi:MAG: hypothetical protein ABIH37_05570 [archaeon]
MKINSRLIVFSFLILLLVSLIGVVSAKNVVKENTPLPIALLPDQTFLIDIQDGESDLVFLDFDVQVRQSGNHYYYKLGMLSETDCNEIEGYSEPIHSSQNIVEDISLLPDGDVRLCLLGVKVKGDVIVYGQGLDNPTVYEWYKDTSYAVPPELFNIFGPTGILVNQNPEISWEEAVGADSYDLTIASDSSCLLAVQSYPDLTSTSKVLTTSLADGDYYSCVTAKNFYGSTEASNNGLAFSVDVTPPDAFYILSPIGTIDDNTPEVNWEIAAGATSYDLIISTLSDCSVATQEFLDLSATSQVLAELADNTYYTCVTAKDDVGNSIDASNNGVSFVVDTIPPFKHLIFATEVLTNIGSGPDSGFPNFYGIDEADYICTISAWDAGYVPDWNGVDIFYKALLSDESVDARDHITVVGPIYNMNGDLIAYDATDLWDGDIQNPIAYDENGNVITGDLDVWSGSSLNGTWNTGSCGNHWDIQDDFYEGTNGILSLSNEFWFDGASSVCTGAAHLYCVSPPIAVE